MAAACHSHVSHSTPATCLNRSARPTSSSARVLAFSMHTCQQPKLEACVSRRASTWRADPARLSIRCTAAQPALQPTPGLPHVNWAARAIKAFGMAELEARKLKYPTTGTEALLMGILTEGTSTAARFLRSKGVKLLELRDETVKLLGKADMYYFSAEHPPLTPQAESALNWAIDEHKRRGGEGEVSPEFILLGIWEQKEQGAGYRLLANLGLMDAHVEELRQLISS